MATAENAKLEYEAGQTSTAMSALTDTGDATVFSSAGSIWSARSGYAPLVRPNGLLTGGAVSTNVTNNMVTVASMTLNLNGTVASVVGGTATATRPAAGKANICSVTINAAAAIAVVAGTDSATTVLIETRGAAGGPPFIPVDSVEIAQVRLSSNTAAPIAASEIYQVVGSHRERADFPLYDIAYGTGKVTFISANPLIHTASVSKKVFASYAAPIFAMVSLASDFVPAEVSHSVSSQQVYGATIGATSQTLGQGSFKAYLADGITDPLITLKNSTLWFRFYPDRYQAPYLLTQGKLGISRTYPAANQIVADCTISSSSASTEQGS